MDYSELQNEAMSLSLSNDAQELVVDIGTNAKDPVEAAILGFSCGMLAVKRYIEGVTENE